MSKSGRGYGAIADLGGQPGRHKTVDRLNLKGRQGGGDKYQQGCNPRQIGLLAPATGLTDCGLSLSGEALAHARLTFARHVRDGRFARRPNLPTLAAADAPSPNATSSWPLLSLAGEHRRRSRIQSPRTGSTEASTRSHRSSSTRPAPLFQRAQGWQDG